MATKTPKADKSVPAAVPAVPALKSAPAVPPPVGRRAGKAALTAAGSMAGVVLPVVPNGGKAGTIDYMAAVLLANPQGVSLSQLAQACVDTGHGPKGFAATRHTAQCQWGDGKQGQESHGMRASVIGTASDGEPARVIDTAQNEREVYSLYVEGAAWENQPKRVVAAFKRGFPWAISTPEGKAIGLRGGLPVAVPPAPIAPPVAAPKKKK